MRSGRPSTFSSAFIQAFIFALLTILYFSQSMELDEEH
jgi:F0F1-type ATP synthase membrane subunit a